jgi:hypothetical protein
MPRKANPSHLDTLRKAIETHPGNRAGFFARLLDWHREEVNRKLVTLNDRGVLLWEDDRGGLWLFDKKIGLIGLFCPRSVTLFSALLWYDVGKTTRKGNEGLWANDWTRNWTNLTNWNSCCSAILKG